MSPMDLLAWTCCLCGSVFVVAFTAALLVGIVRRLAAGGGTK